MTPSPPPPPPVSWAILECGGFPKLGVTFPGPYKNYIWGLQWGPLIIVGNYSTMFLVEVLLLGFLSQ